MKCPCCGYSESKVIDSRPVEEGNSIRRRRECLACQKRFNTFEVLESVQIIVIKKSGEKELFDRTKLLGGILKATQKRPVNAAEIADETGFTDASYFAKSFKSAFGLTPKEYRNQFKDEFI